VADDIQLGALWQAGWRIAQEIRGQILQLAVMGRQLGMGAAARVSVFKYQHGIQGSRLRIQGTEESGTKPARHSRSSADP
jgi:hypothetical protein